MATITYCKGLPTPASEMNSLGFTELEMFLSSFAPLFHKAACETVDHLLSESKFNKSIWNTHLQKEYGILKRHANGVISNALGLVDSASLCRENHIKTLTGKLKSLEKWIKKTEKKLKNAAKFYAKKNWQNSKTGCCLPLSSSRKFKNTNWQHLRFQLHHKKRRCYKLSRQIEYLKTAPVRVKVPRHQVFIVGSKDETCGNQICQWDGNYLQFRTPTFLEPSFGKHVSSQIGNFERNINRLPATGAKTWHFYRKDGKWCVAVQLTPLPVKLVTHDQNYGCIGIDMNPGS